MKVPGKQLISMCQRTKFIGIKQILKKIKLKILQLRTSAPNLSYSVSPVTFGIRYHCAHETPSPPAVFPAPCKM